MTKFLNQECPFLQETYLTFELTRPWIVDIFLLLPLKMNKYINKTKVIRANLLDFAFDLDFYFDDIIRLGNISVLVTFQF